MKPSAQTVNEFARRVAIAKEQSGALAAGFAWSSVESFMAEHKAVLRPLLPIRYAMEYADAYVEAAQYAAGLPVPGEERDREEAVRSAAIAEMVANPFGLMPEAFKNAVIAEFAEAYGGKPE